MLDSVQGRAPGMAFLPYCSLPELEACMECWSFMEMIHSRSYTYIVKNVYSNPAEVFDTILRDEKILERAASVTESYDTFINCAQDWGASNNWRDDWRDHINALWTRKDLKRNLYRLTGLDGPPNHVLDAPYESIDAALKAAKIWCNGQGLSCTIKDRGIGVQVLAGNGTWRTVCYPSNCLQTALA